MQMIAVKIAPPANDLTCEHCGEKDGEWGIAAKRDLEDIATNAAITKKEKVSFLIFETGAGEILCPKCLEKRAGRPIKREPGRQ